MHADKARKIGVAIAGGAATAVLVNFINIIAFWEDYFLNSADFTFMYVASAFAILGSIFMIFAFIGSDHLREKI